MEKPAGKSCVRKTCQSEANLDGQGNCIFAIGENQQLIDGVVYTRPIGCANLVVVSATGKVRCSDCETGYHFEIGACVLDGGVSNLQTQN